MKTDRPLYVLASRAAILLGIPLAEGPPGFPANPHLRAEVRLAADGHGRRAFLEGLSVAVPVWLDLTREVGPWQLVARDGAGFRVVLFEGSTPRAFRAAFDAWRPPSARSRP